MDNARMAALIAIAAIIVAAVYVAIYLLAPATDNYDRLARCLAEKGAIMYGTDGCHFCQYQKSLLGESFKYVNYVDCVQQYEVCVNQQIGGMPTWLINGTFHASVLTPEQLANLSGCVI